jgi:hypothetical protein
VTRLWDPKPVRVVLGGVDEAVANLERELPPRVAARAVRVPHLTVDDPARDVVAAIEPALQRVEEEDERAVLAEIVTQAASPTGGRGAVGLAQVIDALNRARPMRVLVKTPLDREVRQCGRCATLSLEGARCAVCGEETLALDATEAIVRAAVGLGARVDVIGGALLDEVGGAAASLRF